MTREEFNKFLAGVSKDAKVEYMLGNGWDADNDIAILPTGDLVSFAELPSIAKAVKQSDLTLAYEFVRTGVYYKDYTEADTEEELVSDQEVKDYFEDYFDDNDFEEVVKDLSTY